MTEQEIAKLTDRLEGRSGGTWDDVRWQLEQIPRLLEERRRLLEALRFVVSCGFMPPEARKAIAFAEAPTP